MIHRAKSIMLLGTHSNAGKSLLAAAFCRILARKGYRVAPFKAQNMSNNAGVTAEGGEMGRAQIVQAEAAGVASHTDMNPVLLKPEQSRRSQVILNGKAIGHLDAKNWHEIRQRLWPEVQQAYDRLAQRYDVIVLEGAGSPAEINLKDNDIVNLRMARYAGAPCLLIGDIDRGGVFAALAGTMLLLESEEREQIKGFLINKFRGDISLLGDGLTMLQERAYGVPTLGVIPMIPDLRVASEDAVVLDAPEAKSGEPAGTEIVVIHLPHIANFDEFDLLAAEPGVCLRYIQYAEELGHPAAIILPGTKSTLADLRWLKRQGLDRAVIQAFQNGSTVVGICGGYQMLGKQIEDPEGVESNSGDSEAGLGLLPTCTVFKGEKHTYQSEMLIGDLRIRGYEIHAGETTLLEPARSLGMLVKRSGNAVNVEEGIIADNNRAWGCYLHGIFENENFRRVFLQRLGWSGGSSLSSQLRDEEYNRLADAVEGAVNWAEIERIIGLPVGDSGRGAEQ